MVPLINRDPSAFALPVCLTVSRAATAAIAAP